MKRACVLLGLIFLVLCSAHAEEAPFGLIWGASVDDTKAAGVELKEFTSTEFGSTFLATKLGKALSDQEITYLSFGFDNKLWRIAAVSRSFENDPYGNSIKERYQDLVAVLTSKYGSGKQSHNLGGSIYSEPKYFLAGINGGQSSWFSNFNTSSVFIQIGILASDSSTARWRIIFEHREGRRSFEAAKRNREKGAL